MQKNVIFKSKRLIISIIFVSNIFTLVSLVYIKLIKITLPQIKSKCYIMLDQGYKLLKVTCPFFLASLYLEKQSTFKGNRIK